MIQRKKGSKDALMTLELVKAEAKDLPDSVFAIPEGYSKQTTPGGAPVAQTAPAAVVSPAEQQKKHEEMMKRLTPEQRERMNRLMKETKQTK